MEINEITFNNLKRQIEDKLQKEHNKADIIFSVASPYGQILTILEELYQLSMLYLKNTINQFDIGANNYLNERIIRNAAIFCGHIPSRSNSATGTILLTTKTDAEIETDIPGARMTIVNRSSIKNKTNGLEYSINIGSETQTYNITTNTKIFLPIIQGRWESKIFTGDGKSNQTYSVTVRGSKDIENFNVEVTVDGEFWSIKKHLYDILPDEKACVVRTGFDMGIDVIFGNSAFGKIPEIGKSIEVEYIVTDGANGSIFRRTPNDWTFINQPVDVYGITVDVAKVFDISIFTDINFGSAKESIEFTKNLLPISSDNFVIALPQQYAYHIKKLGIFSYVNAYEYDGIISIIAAPNIKLFKNKNADYFSVGKDAFVIDNYEKSKIDKYLKIGGNIMLTKKYKIDSPTLSYYILNIFIITYSDSIDDNVNSQIYDKISQYFLDFNHINRIPKVNIIKKLSDIEDIHSIDISFVCKNNEDYHRKNKIIQENKEKKLNMMQVPINIVQENPFYDKNRIIGIDPTLGDILFHPGEMPIVRGGWVDRNNVYYSDNINGTGLKSVNIIHKGKVDVKNKSKIHNI